MDPLEPQSLCPAPRSHREVMAYLEGMQRGMLLAAIGLRFKTPEKTFEELRKRMQFNIETNDGMWVIKPEALTEGPYAPEEKS